MTTQSGGTGVGDGEPVPPPTSFAGLVLSIYNDILANAIHEVVHEAHRAEKLLRTQQVQLTAAAEVPKAASTGEQEDKVPEQRPIGNPMAVFPKEIICPKCKLPRHTLDTLANGTGAKEDKKKYCSKLPFQTRPLHDIYGNPSPTVSVSAKEKKAKAQQAAAQAAAAAENANGDSAAGDTLPGGEAGPAISIPNGRKPDAVVYTKCPNCSTEKIAIARFSAHLEKCLGLAGRKSSRAAMAKMSGSGSGSGAGSPALGVDSVVGAGVGKASGKITPDVETPKKERSGSFIVTEEGINVPPPPAPLTGTGKVPGTLPKKKKKLLMKDSNTSGTGPTDDSKDSAMMKVESQQESQTGVTSSNTINSNVTPVKDPKDSTAPPKKRKRKSEATTNGDGGSSGSPFKGEKAEKVEKLEKTEPSVVTDDKDASITVARTKPPLKKAKLDGPLDGSPLKKSQISKFKDRDSPGPTPKKSDAKRDSTQTLTGGKFPPSAIKNAQSPPPSAIKASSPVPAKHPPSGSPKPSTAKLANTKGNKKSTATSADGVMRKVKSSPGTSGSTVSPNAGSLTPKIAKKALPGSSSSGGVNVPAPPGRIAGKSLPKTPISGAAVPATPLGKEKKDVSPEKMKRTMSNGPMKAGIGGTPKQKLAKTGATPGGGNGGGTPRTAGGKTVAGKSVPGKRAVAAAGFAGSGDGDGGVPRKRPKVEN